MRHILFILFLTLSANAQSLPERWVDAYNTGSAATMEAFAKANYAPSLLERRTADQRREMYETLWREHGRFDVQGIRMRGDTARLNVEPERGEPLRLTFTLDGNRIAMIGIDTGGEDEPSPLPPLEVKGDFNESLDAYLKKVDFSGAVLIAKDDDVRFERAYGMASRRFGVPNEITTRFDVGSITKDFTKVAIGQLAQAGKLKISDTIATHLPSYPNKDVANRITIEQLLKHTSGLGDVFTPEFFNLSRMRLRKLADYLAVYADDPLLFEPGTNRRYSNYGYIVLGLIIEAVSGESYYDYVRRHIFEPAGMSASGFFETDKVIPGVAVGHTRMMPGSNERSNEWMENTMRLAVRGSSAGGSHSTARDLFKFARWRRRSAAEQSGAFAGGAPGVNAVIVSDGEWTVVVLANVDPPVAEALGERVIRPALR